MPHLILQDVLVIPEEIIPVQRQGKVPFQAKLMDSHDGGGDLSMGGQQDELVVTAHGRPPDDVHDECNVGFVGQGNRSRHVPVVVGVGPVHRGRQAHCA